MMQIALARLKTIWPDATIQVLTDDPNQLPYDCPQILPMAASGRHAWVQSGLLHSGIYRRLPVKFRALFRRLRRNLSRSSPSIARRLAALQLRSLSNTDSDALDRYLESVLHADLVIVTGMGGITDAFPEYAFGLLETLDLAIECGAMTAMVGQGLGPLERRDLVAIAKRVLPKINFISLREGLYGVPLLDRMGVGRDRVAVTGDDAIELAYQCHAPVVGNHLGVNVRRASYSALGPPDMDALRASIAGIIEFLKCPAISVPVSRRAEESDSRSFADLMGGQDDVSQSGQNITTPAQLIDQIGRCRLVIVGSYHAAVFALAQGVSAIGLAGNAYYIQKFEGLAHQFGSGCEVIRFHDAGFQEKLKSAAIRMWNAADDRRPQLLSRAAQQVAASKAAYETLSQKANARFAATSGHA